MSRQGITSRMSARSIALLGLAALLALVPSAVLSADAVESIATTTTEPPTTTTSPATTTTVTPTTTPESTTTTASTTATTPPASTAPPPTSAGPTSVATTSPAPQVAPTASPSTTTTTTSPSLLAATATAAAPVRPAPTCYVSITVQLGTRGVPAQCVETRLVQYGYWLRGPNDNFDATAVHALTVFQSRNSLSANGVADKATLQALGIWTEPPPRPAPTCSVSITVQLGTRGVPARCVETRLVQYGYWLRGPDDNFDATAVHALKVFQSRSGLADDGIAGRTTLRALGIWTEPRPMPPPTCLTAWAVRGGDTGLPARCVETRLVQLGYWLRGPDNLFDSTAVTALQMFQSRQGLAATGTADYQTLVRLGIWRPVGHPAPTCRVHYAVRLGSTGTTARCVEARLVQLGYWLVGPNSTFDTTAVRALKTFQYRSGLSSDGVAGMLTLQRLGIYNPTPPPPPPVGQVPANSGSGRRIVYSRAQQRIWAVDANGTVVKTHRVSGRTYEPYAGTYRVFSRSLNTYSASDPSVRWRYMVRFTRGPGGGNIGFHEIPNRRGRALQTKEQLGLPLSGGCVRQASEDALWVWNWAGIGTVVVVL